MEKIKSWLKSKTAKVATAASVVSTALMVGAGAEDTTGVTAAFTTGFTKMASDALAMIAVIVPIAIGVAGVQWLTRKAMGWFKGLAK